MISCSSSKKTEYNEKKCDYAIINQLLEKIKKQNISKNIKLDKNNSNDYIISIIQELKKYELIENHLEFDSLVIELGLSNDKTLEKFLNQKEFNYMISQKWNWKKIGKKSKNSNFKNNFESKQIVVSISKPVYTSNHKFALVFVKTTWSGIIVLKKNNTNWEEYKLISPLLLSKKTIFK